jgi:ATP dependent DNA ligase domain
VGDLKPPERPMPRPSVAVLPTVEPIVPVVYPAPFDGPEWLFEPKYDGFRGLLYLSGRECRFRSKRGNRLRRFDQLCYWVREELGTRDVILDGEVVALDEYGRQDFRLLMAGRGNLHYGSRGGGGCNASTPGCSGGKGVGSGVGGSGVGSAPVGPQPWPAGADRAPVRAAAPRPESIRPQEPPQSPRHHPAIAGR